MHLRALQAVLSGLIVTASLTGVDSRALAGTWVERLTTTMEEHASKSDVDHLLELYAEDAVYEHPHAGARVVGRAAMRQGMSSHLGETREPRIQIARVITGEDFAVVEFTLKADVRQGDTWSRLERRQVVLLEFKDSHIQRIVDHWGE